MVAADAAVGSLDGVICLAALIQLLRLHLHHPQAGWTRQKVFLCMLFAANFGYTLYFILSPWASCGGWPCWSHACGFILLAVPQIIFLASFLLLLSFWVDLCHQATDRFEEEEEDDIGEGEGPPSPAPSRAASGVWGPGREGGEEGTGGSVRLPLLPPKPWKPRKGGRRRRACLCWRNLRVRGRQKVVIGVVVLICLLTGAFAVLIWVGMGNNPIDSVAVARLHKDFFACVMLILGGGLAGYGLVLFSKMSRLRSGRSSADLSKVAWFAAICLVCFTAQAFLVLAKNVPVAGGMGFVDSDGNFYPLAYVLYYVVGEGVPSIVMLIILRGMPPKSRESSVSGGQEYPLPVGGLEDAVLPQWVVPPGGSPYSVIPSPTVSPT